MERRSLTGYLRGQIQRLAHTGPGDRGGGILGEVSTVCTVYFPRCSARWDRPRWIVPGRQLPAGRDPGDHLPLAIKVSWGGEGKRIQKEAREKVRSF